MLNQNGNSDFENEMEIETWQLLKKTNKRANTKQQNQ